MYTRDIAGLLAAAFLLVEARPLGAQSDPAGEPAEAVRQPSVLCWRPRPEAQCRSWFVTQLSFEKAIMATDDGFGGRFVGSFGPMINRGPTSAWGILGSYSTDDPDEIAPLRIEGRYRRWLGSSAGLELGLGFTQANIYDDSGNALIGLRGLTAALGIEQGLFGVNGRVDLMRGGGDTEVATYVGVTAGGAAGPIAAATLVVGFFALFAMFGGS